MFSSSCVKLWARNNPILLHQLKQPLMVCLCPYSKLASKPVFKPKKVLILTKLSRYEFEKRRHRHLTEDELENSLTTRGSDYNMLLHRHTLHKTVENSVKNAFIDAGIDTRVVNRFDYNDKNIDWADVIVTTGGDGTYLLAAAKLPDNTKPIIGFNSDPSRSKGQLCLPVKYSANVKEAVDKLLKGMFQWQFRSRIRITLVGKDINDAPVELHDQQMMYPEHRYLDIDQQLLPTPGRAASSAAIAAASLGLDTRVLPVLALNEVFIGECVSARVSYLEIKLDDEAPVKQKCSGLIVSTGTGSTSWTYNVNKLTEQSLEQILTITQEQTGQCLHVSDSKVIRKITNKFNELLLNDPEDNRLVYTIRDQLIPPLASIMSGQYTKTVVSSHAVADVQARASGTISGTSVHFADSVDIFVDSAYEQPNSVVDSGVIKPRGFVQTVHVRSRCFDASLVIDGGLSFKFNDGTRAVMEMHDGDALRNVVLDENVSVVTFKH